MMEYWNNGAKKEKKELSAKFQIVETHHSNIPLFQFSIFGR